MWIAMIGAKGIPATIGGIERHVDELGGQLAARGFDVTVYARPWYTGRAPWSVAIDARGVRIAVLPSWATKHLDALSHTFLATLHAMRARPDIYHFHGVGPSLLAFLPRLFRPRARVVATFHCVDRRHAKWGRIARWVLRCGERAACAFPHETITVGETLARYCRERYGRATTYIPNGVALPPHVPNDRVADILQAFGLLPRRFLLVVARFVPHKGVHTVIAAFQNLRAAHPELRDLQLAIIGAPAFTDTYAAELRRLATGDPAVRFLGIQTVPALDVLYASCLAFVHASRSEGLPIAVLEAAVAGAVPVISDIPEHREIIERIGGFLFRVEDPEDCATVLQMVISGRRALPRIGGAIRDAALRSYSWDMIAARTAACYRGCSRPSRATFVGCSYGTSCGDPAFRTMDRE